MEAWQGISSSALSKEGQQTRRCIFIIGVGTSKSLGCDGFCPNFSKLVRKVFCATFVYKFFSTKIMKISFSCNLQKRSSCVFMRTSDAISWSQTTLGAIFTRISRGFYQDFQQSKKFGSALANPALPPPTPLIFITVLYIISYFIKIDLKQIYYSYSGTQNTQNDFL